ncbi:GNAT family N-acetyltransferase [Streptomonospora salina]|uniref:RimJ/RimL family protein N-acetyltransferase n=1 Tax=Streptomonospora salina TaxID=104205 RepID=A0A841E0H7_9ACTN|nr:GNAT family N-acetyltransferase [Streptomonospora salina]MBB5997247.1 RimJ/RimL family protein N-acetyltransferase [Streptomonospora salina]
MAEATGAACPARPAGAGADLVRLDGAGAEVQRLRAAVLRIRVAPGQRGFVTEAVETLPRADADPRRTPFAVLVGGEPAGFGIIDRGGALAEVSGVAADTARAVLLRAFYLAPEWQGRGVGRRACAGIDPLVRDVHPGAAEVFVFVDEGNRAAERAYAAAGFAPVATRPRDPAGGVRTVMRKPVA